MKTPKDPKDYTRVLMNKTTNTLIKSKCADVKVDISMVKFFDHVAELSIEDYKKIISKEKI
jgi:hypothetical protein